MSHRALDPRPFRTWLAIVALLVGTLLPSAVMAAAALQQADPAHLAFCGGSHRSRDVPNKPATLPCAHCALCAAPALGLLPPRAAPPPQRALVAFHRPSQRLAFAAIRPPIAAAQPRAPPSRRYAA